MYTIGKVAVQAGVSIDTLRYYEKEGLIAPASRSESGYRLYNDEAVRRIRFIKHSQHCGFTLSEIQEVLALKRSDAACCKDVRQLAIEKKLQIEYKIKTMRAMSKALDELIVTCNDETKPLDDCPILAALENSLAEARR
jgi:Zn(II)-responsive transcriptional regulator